MRLRNVGRDERNEVRAAAGPAGGGGVQECVDEHARAGEVVGVAGFGDGVGGEEDGVGVCGRGTIGGGGEVGLESGRVEGED